MREVYFCTECGKELFGKKKICLDCKYKVFEVKPKKETVSIKKYNSLNARFQKVSRENIELKKSLKKIPDLIKQIGDENSFLKDYIKNNNIENLKKEYELKMAELQSKLNEVNNIQKLSELKSIVNDIPEQLKEVKYGVSEFNISDNIPKVYFLVDDNKIVYVGKTEKKLLLRISDHVRTKRNCFNRVFYTDVQPGFLDYVEQKYIKMFKPIYNITHNGR